MGYSDPRRDADQPMGQRRLSEEKIMQMKKKLCNRWVATHPKRRVENCCCIFKGHVFQSVRAFLNDFLDEARWLARDLHYVSAKPMRNRRPHSMASFVTQAQVAHRSLLGPSRLRADGGLGVLAHQLDSLIIRGIWGVGPSPGSGNRPAVKPTWSGLILHTRRMR